MSTCFNLSTTLKVIIWIRIHVDQVLLKTQFCKVVHINEFQFNIILTIIWTNFFSNEATLVCLVRSYKKKSFWWKRSLSFKPDWAKLDRVLRTCHNPIWRNIRHVWVETRISESVDWCDYWSYTLKQTKQISPLIGMVIIAETRNPAKPIFDSNWHVWNRFPKY